ncbi:MAG: hypothetical protein V7606_1474 [Burkholderiales bacterium]
MLNDVFQISRWGARAFAAGLFMAAITLPAHAQLDASRLLKSSDRARGGGMPGLSWEVSAFNKGGNGDEQNMRLRIKAVDTASVAETLEPPRSRGAKMLQSERNMWLTKPGLKKPIPISPRQRLTGQAAVGDIAATNYARDYEPKLLAEERINDELCYVLELTAKDRNTTYDRLLYWVSAERGVGVRAEFFSLSGKRLKRADFEYNNTILFKGRTMPFISRMGISDELTDARTLLEYSNISVQAIPRADFDVSHLE